MILVSVNRELIGIDGDMRTLKDNVVKCRTTICGEEEKEQFKSNQITRILFGPKHNIT